jgi:hypothetical protein
VDLARRRLWTNAFSMEALYTRILERHRASIRVQKQRLSSDDRDTRLDSRPRLLSMILVAASAADVLTTPFQVRSTPRQMARP